eukprot:4134976-Prymnesium_polylepis.1
MSRTDCARQGAEAIGAIKTRRREGPPVFRTITSVPFARRTRADRSQKTEPIKIQMVYNNMTCGVSCVPSRGCARHSGVRAC